MFAVLLEEVIDPNKIPRPKDVLRKERQVERSFGTHRYWDLVRWRMAREYLDNVRMKGRVFEYDLDNDKYIMTSKMPNLFPERLVKRDFIFQ